MRRSDNPGACAAARVSRRGFLAGASAAGVAAAAGLAPANPKALVAITLDLEMSRNFPTWDNMEWDYQKGNLNEPTKRYTVEAARRIKAAGGVLHAFAVGQTFEQPSVDWLKGIVADGHPVGNHTYDHVNVTARKPGDIQFRFQRSPWLIAGKRSDQVIADNIRLAAEAMRTRLGIKPAGFRTPGGFSNGLADRADLQRMLLEQGYTWISSKYPGHAYSKPGVEPADDVYASIVRAQAAAQPFVYPSGLVEVPMSPISDIGAFRSGRWRLAYFLKAIRMGVEWAIENGAVFDFLGHPSCLYVADPDFKTIDMICDLVRKAGDRAALVDLATIAKRAAP